MHLVRYRVAESSAHEAEAGVLVDGAVVALGTSLTELLRLDLAHVRALVEHVVDDTPLDARCPLSRCVLEAPVEGRMEVWAAGVTYERSRDERMAESTGAAVLYDQVFAAPRPELFFKSVPWRVVGDGDDVGLRSDSDVDVPEPELALVVSSRGEVVGYTICNDVSSRSIEGENPLYLPQAKIFSGSCALAARVRPAWEIVDPYDLTLGVSIERAGTVVFAASGSTGQLHRRLDDLVDWLFRAMDFPDGVVLSTGTSLVPELPFSLAAGDVVNISLSEVGVLSNTARPVAVLGS